MRSNPTNLRRKLLLFTIGLTLLSFTDSRAYAQGSFKNERPRIVITADPELDDNNSLIRFLLFSSELEVEGLVYASSGYHWKGDGKGTRWYVPGREYARFGLDTCPCESWRWSGNERFIHKAVEAYAVVYPNLKVHNPGYPDPELLKSRIRYGNIEFDGDISKDSPGSDLIRSLMLDDKPGKLFITAWGGQSTIARALKSIQDQYENTVQWESIRKKVSRKVILLPSGDQDDTYAKYIKPNWPDIEYRQFWGGPNYGYGAQMNARPEDSVYLTSAWMKENVTDRGPFGKLYRVWGDGKQMVKGDVMDYFGIAGYSNDQLRKMGYVVWMPVQEKGAWLGEGDDGTFMNMPGNGLRAFEDCTYGGWGGRQVSDQEMKGFSSQAGDTSQQAMAASMSSVTGQLNKSRNAYPDFFPAAQRDFAARLKWSVTPKFSDANHAPVLAIEGPLNVLASPGEKIRLNAKVTDPDSDIASVSWWQLQAGTYPGKAEISNEKSVRAKVLVPKDAIAGQTIHIIAEATDNGSPSLTSYQRVIITVRGR